MTMTLPRPSTPVFDDVLPISQQKVSFRPFFVDEEKTMRLALQASEDGETMNHLKKIAKNCLHDTDVDIDSLSTVDFAYLYIKIRTKSIGEKADILIPCDCEKNGTFEVKADLEKIELNTHEFPDPMIDISDGFKLKLRPFSVGDYKEKLTEELEFMQSIEYVYNKDGDSFKFDEYDLKDRTEFAQTLISTDIEKIHSFLSSYPRLKLMITGKCNKCGQTQERDLGEYTNFFV